MGEFPDSVPTEQRNVNGSDGTVSLATAAERLGVSRTSVWWMIADGNLDAERQVRGHRVLTRVHLPEADPEHPELPARSRTARLQDQVDDLSRTVERLSTMLAQEQAAREHAERAFSMLVPGTRMPSARMTSAGARPRQHPTDEQQERRRDGDLATSRLSAAVRWVQTSTRREGGVCQVGITARPNPMTHPKAAEREPHADNREALFASFDSLLRSRQREWWQRLPLVARN